MRLLNSKVYGENTGQKLLVLHGLFGMLDNWSSLARSWAKRGMEVHLLDLRGHGRSFWDPDMSMGAMSEDVFVYINHHNLSCVDILGHSMGGKAAMKFACSHPDSVDKLIVADISPKYYRPHHGHIIAALNDLNKQEIQSRQQADHILAESIEDRAVRGFLLKSLYMAEDKTYRLRFDLESIESSERLLGEVLGEGECFDGRTLFLKGGRSRYICDGDELLIKKHFPNSRLAVIDDAGHWLHADKPDVFAELVVDFLEGRN